MKIRPPIDIHEATVEQHYARDPRGQRIPDPTISRLADVARTARDRGEALAAFAETVVQDGSVLAKAKLRDAALKTAEGTAKKLDAVLGEAKSEIASLMATTNAPPVPKDHFGLGIAAEIRSRLAAMSEKERNETLSKALTDRDLSIIGAVLHAPALLSGFDKARLELLRSSYRTTFHPQEAARLDRLRGAVAALERAGQSFVGFVGKMTTNESVRLAELAQQKLATAELAVLETQKD